MLTATTGPVPAGREMALPAQRVPEPVAAGRSARRPVSGPRPGPSAPRPGTRLAGWRRLLGIGLAGSGVVLLPWMFYLAVSLPAAPVAWHWRAAWVGLDAMEAAALISTGLLLLRRDARHRLTAMAAAGLLLADAWFDVTTAPPGGGLASVLMALLAELPGAAVCIALALARPHMNVRLASQVPSASRAFGSRNGIPIWLTTAIRLSCE